MGLIRLIIDFFKYPFDKDKENNRFNHLIKFLFNEYPAYFWEKPNVWRAVVLPFMLVYFLFKKDIEIKKTR